MTELKPCPCCKGEALYVYTANVGRHSSGSVCLNAFGIAVECEACGLITQGYTSQEKAAEAWNRRADE